VTQALQSVSAPAPQLARLNGSDYVVLMPGMTGPDATRLAQRIRQDLEAMRVSINSARLCRWAMSLTDYTPECDMTMVLSRLDHGLMCAESAGHGDVEYIAYGHDMGSGAGKGATEAQWRTVLFDALAEDRLELAINYTVHINRHSRPGTDNEIVSYDASLMMREGDTLLSGYLFMPAAVRLGLSAQCDLRAISLGLNWLAQHPGYLVVKISLPSLIQASFLRDMQRMLAGQPDYASRLILEIDAHGLLAYRAEVQVFCEQAAALDVRVGVRRLAQQTGALMYLHQAPLSYVKLGGDFITDLLTSPGSQQLLGAITQTAKDLGIAVYAEDVPDDDTASLLHKYGACTLRTSEPFEGSTPSHLAP
jgi:EAL domain-containing protein (putative c-di-GMP-specific phosphodiesterase class I)